MAEYSWLWDGSVTGHANVAPYKSQTFNTWLLAALTNNDKSVVHVVPGYLWDLQLETSKTTPNIVTVRPGAAVAGMYIYENTEDVTFPVQPLASAGQYRYDSILLRVDARIGEPDENTVRLIYRKGYEAATLAGADPYTPIQEDYVWEAEVWRIRVPNITSSGIVIKSSLLFDMRQFLPTFQERQKSGINLVTNAEFMAFANPGSGFHNAPTGWVSIDSGGYADIQSQIPFVVSARGWTLDITTNSTGQGIQQKIQLPQPEDWENYNTFTIEGIIETYTAASVINVTLTPYVFVTRRKYQVADDPVTLLVTGEKTGVQRFRKTVRFDYDQPIYMLVLSVTSAVPTTSFRLGQMSVSPGYFSGGIRPQRGIQGMNPPLIDDSFNGAGTFSSSSIFLDYEDTFTFNRRVPLKAYALIATIRASDSGSVSSNPWVEARSRPNAVTTGIVRLDGIANNRPISEQVIIPLDQTLRIDDVIEAYSQLQISSSGVDTLKLYFEIVGIII